MGNFIMILSLLQALDGLKNQPVREQQVIGKNIGRIAEGMSKKELVDAFGKPSRIESLHNFYSEQDFKRYYYDTDACAYQSKSCTVDLVDGKIAAMDGVKMAE